MTTRKFSRRAVLAGTTAAVVPAAFAALPAMAIDNLDVELLELGRQFEPLFSAWVPALAADREAGWASHGAARLRAGYVVADDGKTYRLPEGVDRSLAADSLIEHLGEAEVEFGREATAARCDAIAEKMDPLAERILSCVPHTVAGLGVMARAMMLNENRLWDVAEARELDDITERQLRTFIEAACSLAGLPIKLPSVVAS